MKETKEKTNKWNKATLVFSATIFLALTYFVVAPLAGLGLITTMKATIQDYELTTINAVRIMYAGLLLAGYSSSVLTILIVHMLKKNGIEQ